MPITPDPPVTRTSISYTIYPANAVFTASYASSDQADSFTFTNEDCTIIGDHLYYSSPTVNVAGTTTFVACGETQTVTTNATEFTPTVYIHAKPEHLYAYTDPNPSGETLYAWTAPGAGLFYFNDNNERVSITDNTIYTKTSTIDTSTNVFYLEDGSEISLYAIWTDVSSSIGNGSSIVSADNNQFIARFTD